MKNLKLILAMVATLISADLATPAEPSLIDSRSAAERGYRFLLENPLIPPDFDQATIDGVWESWPQPLRERAKAASAAERQRMIFERYGLTPRPDAPTKPMQYVVDESRQWTMNCFSCHTGTVYGTHVAGTPNNAFDLQTLTEEIRATKLRTGKPMARMDIGSLVVPLNGTRGVSNAVMFGVALMSFRDPQLNVIEPSGAPKFVHHDMDAPPWWNYSMRDHIYIDGFAQRSHRSLMQFALVRENGPGWFQKNVDAFSDVQAYLLSLRPPKFPKTINDRLALDGAAAFRDHCADCHGHYGAEVHYPGRCVPIDDLGTDRVRFEALTVKDRQAYADSWFTRFGNEATIVAPDGYVAPPLRGVWASAPYFHNGSVPTLWHVLHPDKRPLMWHRTTDSMDEDRIGLTIEEVSRIPSTVQDVAKRREFFDTRKFGKSAAGHDYPQALTDAEKVAVLEYLKTL